MKKAPFLIILGISFMLLPGLSTVQGSSASLELENDEFSISVDPSDPDQGYLEISGTVSSDITGFRDTLTVTLSVNITEENDGVPTGRYWAARAAFEGETVTPEETRLTHTQNSADFTVTTSPEYADPQGGDIAVPPGISPLIEGKLVLKMTYTGSGSGNDVARATITPEYYHLVNLSTPTIPVDVKAGNMLNYTIRVKNAGNDVEGITIEIPQLTELSGKGWNTSLSITDVDEVSPGEEIRSILLMQAPDEIPYDEELELKVRAYTHFIDPDTLEPVSEQELNIVLELRRSKINEPGFDDDSGNTAENNTAQPATSSPYAIIGVITIMVILAVIVVIILFVKRGGGDTEEDDMHSSLVRI